MRAEQIFLFLCVCWANPAVTCRGSTGSLRQHLLRCAPCPSVNLPSPFVAWKHHHQNGGRAANTDPGLPPSTSLQSQWGSQRRELICTLKNMLSAVGPGGIPVTDQGLAERWHWEGSRRTPAGSLPTLVLERGFPSVLQVPLWGQMLCSFTRQSPGDF